MSIRIVHTQDSLVQYGIIMRKMRRDMEFIRKIRTQMFHGPYFNMGRVW